MANIGALTAYMKLDTSEFSSGIALTKKEMREAKRITEEMQSPLERYRDEQQKLSLYLSQGAISQETYARKLAQTRSEYASSLPIVSQYSHLMSPMAAGLAAVGAELAIVAGGVAFLGKTTLEGIDRLDQMADSADAVGMEAQAFQQLRAAAILADAPVENLANTVGKVMQSVAKAEQGDAAMVDTFDRLGLSTRELIRLSPDEMFAKVARAISALPTSAQQLRAMAEIAGRGSFEFRKLFSDFDAFSKEAAQFTLSGDAFAAIGEADDAMKRASLTWENFKNLIAVELAPAVESLASVLARMAETDFTSTPLGASISGLSELVQGMSDAATRISGGSETGRRATGAAGVLGLTAANPLLGLPQVAGVAADMMFGDEKRKLAEAKKLTDDARREANLIAAEAEMDADASLKAALKAQDEAVKGFERMFGKIDAGMSDSMRGVEQATKLTKEAERLLADRQSFMRGLEEDALTAGLDERQRIEFRARQLGMSEADVNTALRMFDRAQAGQRALEEKPAGVSPAVKGSQEAAAAIARWQTQQKDAVDVARDQLEVLQDMRNGIERGAVVIEAVEVP